MYFMTESKAQRIGNYLSKVMSDKGLSTYDVERKSGNEINQSYVNKIKNGLIENPSPDKIAALAKGLGIPEEELFNIVRGVSAEPSSFEKALTTAFHDAHDWTENERADAINFVRTYAEGVRARRERGQTSNK
jgi:transcriptional regulator with XRE-family HTH domain